VTTSQYLEFKHAIRTVEQQHGGPTWTAKYGKLNEAHTAKQRARNTHLRNVAGVGSDGGDGASAGGGGVYGALAPGGSSGSAAGGSGHAAGSGRAIVVDLVIGTGDTPRIPTSAGGGGRDGALAGGGGGYAAEGGGHAAGGGRSTVVNLVIRSGATPRIPCPENWPFTCPFLPKSEIKSKVTWTRAQATKRMTRASPRVLKKNIRHAHQACQ
jgi:hypothetical protein